MSPREFNHLVENEGEEQEFTVGISETLPGLELAHDLVPGDEEPDRVASILRESLGLCDSVAERDLFDSVATPAVEEHHSDRTDNGTHGTSGADLGPVDVASLSQISEALPNVQECFSLPPLSIGQQTTPETTPETTGVNYTMHQMMPNMDIFPTQPRISNFPVPYSVFANATSYPGLGPACIPIQWSQSSAFFPRACSIPMQMPLTFVVLSNSIAVPSQMQTWNEFGTGINNCFTEDGAKMQ